MKAGNPGVRSPFREPDRRISFSAAASQWIHSVSKEDPLVVMKPQCLAALSSNAHPWWEGCPGNTNQRHSMTPVPRSTHSCTLNLYRHQPGTMPRFKHDPTDQTHRKEGLRGAFVVGASWKHGQLSWGITIALTRSSILAWRIPMGRRVWWAIVQGLTKSQTRSSD